ncbi:AraC family transcriptional regulator [Roseovarius sp.]|uniref:AraC family transcriptional regulator n=1 Tax=Roseovarius sp. TaxID=1486281 RepID=UPI003A96C6FE
MDKLSTQVDPIFVAEALDRLQFARLDETAFLKREGLDPAHMSLQEYGRFWFSMAQEMQDEMLGMTEHPMRPGSFALMCHSILGARTLDTAIRRALWFLKVIVGAPYGTMTVRNGQAHIVFSDKGAPATAFCYRTLMIVLLGPISWLARRPIQLSQVAFRCEAPMGSRAYSRLFGTPVQFGAPATRVVFSAEPLSLPVNQTEAALKRYLSHAPGNLLVEYRSNDGMSGMIKQVLSGHPANDWRSFDHLAEDLGVSPSTMRRRLKAEGTSFRTLKSELRKERATALLKEGRLTVAEISDDLGYAEPRAFFRAFRAWTGKAPAAYRAEQRPACA